jgi:hypothetical protein
MEKISIRLPDIIEAIREIAESVEDGSHNGLAQRVEDILFPISATFANASVSNEEVSLEEIDAALKENGL